MADEAAATKSGGWLVSQLQDGLLPSPYEGFPDQGLSIDAALSLQASGQRPAQVETVRDAVAREIDTYAAPYEFAEDFDDPESDTLGATPSNATAKSLVLALETGGDVNDFGGLDLEQQLEDVVGTDGRLSDNPTRNGEPDPEGDDFANVIGQSFAARGLAALGSAEAATALAFLVGQQCDDGSFRLDVAADAAAAAAACESEEPDTDATALALLNLAETPGAAAQAALADGVRWLQGSQRANGSFGGSGPTAAPNANSTGLAGLALAAGDKRKPARKAARWVADLQLVNSRKCRAFDRSDLGAIAYDADALRKAARKGVRPGTADQFRRTTAQVLPVLALAPEATATGPCA